MESDDNTSDSGSDIEPSGHSVPEYSGQASLPSSSHNSAISGEEYRQISTDGIDYKELCSRRRCRHAASKVQKYVAGNLRCYVVQCDIGQNTELTSELFTEILQAWNIRRRAKMTNWLVCECVHEGTDLCMPGRHLHFIYQKFATQRGEHMERFWNILRSRLKDKTDSFNVKKRKIKSKANFVETSCYYGMLAYISSGLYSLYPCKTNLYGEGDIYDQCQLENESDLTEKDYEQYHACHPEHMSCFEDKEDDSDQTTFATLSKFWDTYGPMKVKEIFSNPIIPIQERI